MERNHTMTSFADVMAILLVCFALIAVLVCQKVSEEYKEKLHQVDLLKREKLSQTQSSGMGEGNAYLSVTKGGSYVLQGKIFGSERKTGQRAELRKILASVRPTKLYLRVDRTVPTGDTQDIMLDCADLGILTYLTVATSGGR